jgi:hypothetical protein
MPDYRPMFGVVLVVETKDSQHFVDLLPSDPADEAPPFCALLFDPDSEEPWTRIAWRPRRAH